MRLRSHCHPRPQRSVIHVLGRGAKWSASAYSQGIHGGLTVKFDRKPTDEELTRIEEAANQKITENTPTEVHEMTDPMPSPLGRRHLRSFPLPQSLSRQDFSPSRLERQHVEAALRKDRGVGRIKDRGKWRYRSNKQLLEMTLT
jgi:alanyl-tRNA synthetase